jgi:UDP-N-acetylmuramoyl-tripeptide--D-alanyl-D-alanine ligase
METLLYSYFLDSTGVSTDSRNIQKDCFFIAIKGPSFNGNTFARQAIENGAKYAIVDEKEFEDPDENIFHVDNGLKFLQRLANHHRKQFEIPIIGITGSNGKTSTKELIAAVLSEKYSILATKGNLNNHIGVPLTLLQLTNDHEIAVVEMGANHFGDIKELCDIAEPTHGIITNIGKAHLEGFKNFEGVLQTKKELYKAVELAEGLIMYNADDSILKEHLPINTLLMSYGTIEAEITGRLERLTPFVELSWSKLGYTSPLLKTHLVGQYNFYNFLAAIAFGSLFEVEPNKINHAIEAYEPTNKRSQVAKTQKNTLILDCYNANPTSMRSALDSFSQIEHQDKYFIIGDMLELGDESSSEHKEIVDLIDKLSLKGILVGKEFSGFHSENIAHSFNSTKELIEFIKVNPIEDKLILLKGSRGIGLEVLEEYL